MLPLRWTEPYFLSQWPEAAGAMADTGAGMAGLAPAGCRPWATPISIGQVKARARGEETR